MRRLNVREEQTAPLCSHVSIGQILFSQTREKGETIILLSKLYP